MTIFVALLSTTNTEITHQICERLAFMLESNAATRYAVYNRMKDLYDTRSKLVHGTIENKRGEIKYSDLRSDAKITIVPDQDYFDIFTYCVRLFRAVLNDSDLLTLHESENSRGLKEYYLRLHFQRLTFKRANSCLL